MKMFDIRGYSIDSEWRIAAQQLQDLSLALGAMRVVGEPTTSAEAKSMRDFDVIRSIEDGIERVDFCPRVKKFETPLLIHHGMWHGAWAWEELQQYFAELGWESRAYSLPGHGKSPSNSTNVFHTMQSYRDILAREIDRLPVKPVVIGHSMGGAVAQWYLKERDDLPATVFIASLSSHSTYGSSAPALIKRDPWAGFGLHFLFSTNGYIRNPKRIRESLLSDDSIRSAEELQPLFARGAWLAAIQHNPPLWSPPKNLETPLLWLAARDDAIVPEKNSKQSAKFYGAEFISIPGAHNLMMEPNRFIMADAIHDWLIRQSVN